MNVLLIVAMCVVMGVLAQLLLKKGMNTVGLVSIKDLLTEKVFSIVFDKFVLVGLALYGLSALLWLVALSMEEVSYIYPLVGTGYILTAILAWVFLGENLTVMRLLGIALISLGACVVIMKL